MIVDKLKRFFLSLIGKVGIKQGHRWTWVKEQGNPPRHHSDCVNSDVLGNFFPCSECCNWATQRCPPGRSYFQPKKEI